MGKIIDKACEWLVSIANDDSHGYSQDSKKRWLSPDIDCSSFIIYCWKYIIGLPLKCTFTGDMKEDFEKNGFKSITYQKSIPLKKGDILLSEKYHVVTYLGDGRIVHASRSETGGKYGKSGDQDGKEVCIRDFYIPSYGWDFILRYVEDDESTTGNPYPEPTVNLSIGSIGPGIKWLQYELNEAGASLQEDGDFGKLTKQALMDFQRAAGIEVDGILGIISRLKLKQNTTKVIGVKPKNPYTRPTRVLKKGCKGDDVKYIQWCLNQKGYKLQEDGSYGNLTANAVYDFQKKAFPNQPSEWDKIVGQKTLKALES